MLGLGLSGWLRVDLNLTLTDDLRQAMVMTHTHAKGQGQRSVGSEDRAETEGWTDRC